MTSENNEGPIAHHAFALYRELAKLGWHVVLLVDEKKVPEPYETPEGVQVKNWPSSRATTWADAWFLVELIKFHRPHALIGVYGSVNLTLLVGYLMQVPVRLAWYCSAMEALRLNFPGPAWYFRFLKWRKRQVYRFATGIISVYKAGVEDFKKHFHQQKHAISCACLNPDPKPVVRDQKHDIDPYLTFVGNLQPSKDPFTPIRSLSRLKTAHPSLKLYILGDGPLKGELKTYAKVHQVYNQVRFLGACSHSVVYQWLANSLANFCTSTVEGFGKVNTQALGLGVPIIVTKIGGMREILREGYNGFGIQPHDDQAAAEYVKTLLSNPVYWKKLSDQARLDFEQRFQLETQVAAQAKQLSNFLKN